MALLNQKNILKTLLEHRVDLKRFGVKRIGLFGSYAKGRQRMKSDIDFLVTFDEDTFDNYIGLKFFLQALFKKDVDLVIESNLKPDLAFVKGEAIYAEAL